MNKLISIDPVEQACILRSLFGSSVVLLVVHAVPKNIINVTKYLGTSRLLMGLLHNVPLLFF